LSFLMCSSLSASSSLGRARSAFSAPRRNHYSPLGRPALWSIRGLVRHGHLLDRDLITVVWVDLIPRGARYRGLDRVQYLVAAVDLVDAWSLADGQPARFRATRTERGPRARDVRLASACWPTASTTAPSGERASYENMIAIATPLIQRRHVSRRSSSYWRSSCTA
jgi:hypothetical protein